MLLESMVSLWRRRQPYCGEISSGLMPVSVNLMTGCAPGCGAGSNRKFGKLAKKITKEK